MQRRTTGRASAAMTAKSGYALLAAAAGAFSLLMGALGQPAYLVLFGAISLYSLKQAVRRRRAPAAPSTPADGMRDTERGGFPLVVLAVTAMLLALSVASFAMNAVAASGPANGICDYDHAAAVAVAETKAGNGSVILRREFCDDHTGYFLLLNPLHPDGLRAISPAGVTYLGRPISFWSPIFSSFWAMFALFMIASSVNLASTGAGRGPLLVICGFSRGVLALTTGFVATLLFVIVPADLAARLASLVPRPGSLAGVLVSTGWIWPLYTAMLLSFAAFLAIFLRRRGGGG